MKLWIDADACPNPVKDVVYKTVQRLRIPCVLVANQPLRPPSSPLIRSVVVQKGFDEADNYLVAQAQPGDVVITADIPLAADLVKKAVHVLDPRGTEYDSRNIGERLGMRNFMTDMRNAYQLQSGGAAPYSAKDKQQFANGLDRLLTRLRQPGG